MLLKYVMKNGAFHLKNSIWPTNNFEKCFQGLPCQMAYLVDR